MNRPGRRGFLGVWLGGPGTLRNIGFSSRLSEFGDRAVGDSSEIGNGAENWTVN